MNTISNRFLNPRTLTRHCLFYSCLAIMISGCIGTDFLEETANVTEPRIVIDPEISAISIGEALNYSATYYDSTDSPVTTSFSWESSNLSVATINETGSVMGIAMGQTRIRATAFGISSENALLTVVGDPNAVAFVDVTPMDTSVVVRQTIQFSATTSNAARDLLTDRPIGWRVDIDSLASITENGVVTARKPGIVKVTASSEGIDSQPIMLEIFAMSRSGTFRAAPNTSYTVKGRATLEQVSGGGLRLKFDEEFQSSNGPGLNVYLSTESVVNATSLLLGELQRTSGEQTYTVPPHVEMNDFDHVIIHCLPFNVTFGSAPLS